jgi:serine/threonine protein kinase
MQAFDVGAVIDRRYLIKREIARGGVATVFEAEHLFTKRAVAVKVLTGGHDHGEARERLLREAHVLTLARHAGVVAALDAGTTETGVPYLVLELLEGRSLGGILAARQRLGPPEAVALGLRLCEVLAVAHERGIVHRDVKPYNVFVARDDAGREAVKLIDFGIASLSGSPVRAPKLTQAGVPLGTPEYMAPEQLLARDDLDLRADVYSLGVTLYECLAGVVPFEGTFGEVLLKVNTEQAPPLGARVTGLPVELGKVIDKAISRVPADRFSDAREFGRALQRTVAFSGKPESLLGLRRAEGELETPGLEGERAKRPAPPPLPATRRRFARAPYVTPVRILRQDNSILDGRSEDISVGGLLVLTDTACAQQEPVRVRFALPLTGKIIEVAATARWVRMARRTGAVGLEFSALPPEAHSGIEFYVKTMGGS